MGYGGTSYGGGGYGDSGSALITFPVGSYLTDWEVLADVGLRGGYMVDLPGLWTMGLAYAVTLHLLGDTYVALGLHGNGADCYPRSGEEFASRLPVITPALPPGLYRVKVAWAGGGEFVLTRVIRAMRDDLVWDTFQLRRYSPIRPYKAMGPRRARNDR